MHISVVIPTYNRARLLNETVPALAQQQTSADITYEVIFVSNGSTDNTEAVLQGAAGRFPGKFRYFRIEPTGGPSAPRNIGIRAACGEALIILDDDVLPERDLVQRFAEFHMKYPEQHHAAVGEAYVPEHLLSDPMSRFHAFPYKELRRLDRLTYLHFWTCCVSIKRQFMMDCGMFDEEWLCYEDILCGHKLAANGMHLRFWPSARGQHLHQMTLEGLASKGLWFGRWLHPLIERIPDPLAKQRFGILSTDLPPRILLRRAIGRFALRIADNPLTMIALEFLGAKRLKRNAVTDLYYELIFRRNVLSGYHEARRQARAGQQLDLTNVDSSLADRGDR